MAGHEGSITVDWQYLPVAVIRMDMGKNAINPEFIRQLNAALDSVLLRQDVKALVTMGTGKFYCYGMDLDYVAKLAEESKQAVADFANNEWHGLLLRLLVCPVPTIAAINGHAFGGGAVLSLNHDYRIMNGKRGWWNTNEVIIGAPIPPRTMELAKIKLAKNTFHEALVLGRRYTAQLAHDRGIVHHVSEPDTFLVDAVKLAQSLIQRGGYDRDTLSAVKANVYKSAIEAKRLESKKTTFPKTLDNVNTSKL